MVLGALDARETRPFQETLARGDSGLDACSVGVAAHFRDVNSPWELSFGRRAWLSKVDPFGPEAAMHGPALLGEGIDRARSLRLGSNAVVRAVSRTPSLEGR